ncbi:MAG: hypothetical protein GY854_30280 [Deltaproteobacteria bacterium]|nr:hypothetical protein [Deltaproteobacteria bacterium]
MSLHSEMALGIGGSESPILMLGEHYGKTTEDLYCLKRGLTEPEDLDGVPDIQRGKTLEPIAADEFARTTGLTVIISPVFLRDGAMIGHRDATVVSPDGKYLVLEIKCPRSSRYHRMLSEGADLGHQVQCQHYMHISGAPMAYLALFCADMWELTIIEIPRNDRLIKHLVSRCEKFWDGVQRGELVEFPPLPHSDFPKIGAQAVEFEADYLEQWSNLERQKADIENQIAQYKQALMNDWPDDAKKITSKLGSISLIQNGARETFDSKRFRAEHPEIYEQYKKTGRPGRPYFKTSWRGNGK